MGDNKRTGLLRRGLRRARQLGGRLRSAAPAAQSGTVRFVGRDGVLAETPAEAGETLLRVAVVSRLDLSHYCGGTCSCGTCRVEILEGADTLSPVEGREQMVLGYQATQAGDRLACQARVGGDVVVRIPDDF